ncbi:hypothetical protein [Thalassobaculum sp.]|uniref:hypothetical protein n=1 Tax=Thalassobaculum sp. TaxID=2022740 RepID=UPI0032ECD39B
MTTHTFALSIVHNVHAKGRLMDDQEKWQRQLREIVNQTIRERDQRERWIDRIVGAVSGISILELIRFVI